MGSSRSIQLHPPRGAFQRQRVGAAAAAVAAAAVAASVLVAACGSGPAVPGSPGVIHESGGPATQPAASAAAGGARAVSPLPAGPVIGLDWSRADVAQPAELITGPASPPPFCSPCHSITQTYLTDVAGVPGHLVGVGSLVPTAAAAWQSADGRRWSRLDDFPAPPGSIAEAVAADRGTWVVVGSGGADPAAWRSSDGTRWDGPIRLGRIGLVAAVVAVPEGGFIAGGYVGPAAARRPAIWRSADGRAWDGPILLSGARGAVHGLAAGPGEVVAVGDAGDADLGPGAGWSSPDGTTWTAALPGDALAPGPLHAVAWGPAGWIAVGTVASGGSAAVWRSVDGQRWTPAPTGGSLANYGMKIVMTGIAVTRTGYVAVGWKSDAGNGSAIAWRSADGVAWERAVDVPSFSGGGMAAVAGVGDRLVAVGTTGWPDNHVASVWLSPPAP